MKIMQWVKDGLLNCLKRNYYFKKSGVRLTLEQKHEWDRTVRPIERAIGKILGAHPYHPPVAKIEGAQALLSKLKDKKGSDQSSKEQEPKKQNQSKGKGENNSVYSASASTLSTDGIHLSRPSSPTSPTVEQSIPIEAGSQEDEEKIIELDEMTSLEKEIRYLHCFEYACHALSQFIVNQAGITISVFEDSDMKPSLTIAKFSHSALENATETLEKSAVASNLPPDQFHEKMLVAAAKKLGLRACLLCLLLLIFGIGSWDAMSVAGNSFAEMLGIKDLQWLSQVSCCCSIVLTSPSLTFSLLTSLSWPLS
jgi:hypothetical protein